MVVELVVIRILISLKAETGVYSIILSFGGKIESFSGGSFGSEPSSFPRRTMH